MMRTPVVVFLALVALVATGEAAHSHRFFQKLFRGEQDIRKDADEELNKQLETLLTKVAQVVQQSHDDVTKTDANGCDCVGDNCGCCANLNLPALKINATACTNFTYNPTTQDISLIMTYNGEVKLNKTFSLHNPPPLCAGLPYVATWCTIFYNITWTPAVGTCLRYELRLLSVTILKIPFGCYQFPSQANAEGIRPVPMEPRARVKDTGLYQILHRQRARENRIVFSHRDQL